MLRWHQDLVRIATKAGRDLTRLTSAVEALTTEPLVIVRGGIAHEHVGKVNIIDVDDVFDDPSEQAGPALALLRTYSDKQTGRLVDELSSMLDDAGDSDDVADWRYEVANGDTRLGFADWLAHRTESDRSTDER